MTTLKIVIDQNNQTLQLLQSQDFANAIESSVLALRCCRQLVVDIDDHGAGRTRCLKECLDHSMMLLQDAPPPPSSSSSLAAAANNHQDVKSDHGSSGSTYRYFVYQQGIEIPPATTDLTMMTPVLVFNAALALHLLLLAAAGEHENEQVEKDDASKDTRTTGYHGGTSSRPSMKTFLLKAKALYQLAHRQVDAKANTLFHFVAINNIAVIDQKLGNQRESQLCFCYLQARYMILMHQRKENRLSHLEGFWRNLPRNTAK